MRCNSTLTNDDIYCIIALLLLAIKSNINIDELVYIFPYFFSVCYFAIKPESSIFVLSIIHDGTTLRMFNLILLSRSGVSCGDAKLDFHLFIIVHSNKNELQIYKILFGALNCTNLKVTLMQVIFAFVVVSLLNC